MPRCSWMGRVVSPLHPPQLRQLSYPFFSSVSSSAIQAVNLWPRRRFLRQLLTPPLLSFVIQLLLSVWHLLTVSTMEVSPN